MSSRAMQRAKAVISAVVTLALVASAVTVAVVSVMRLEGGRSSAAATGPAAPREIKNWRALAAIGTALDDRAARDTILLISDYQCPFCKRADSILAAERVSSRGGIAVRVLHLPIESLHPFARGLAIAAECAAEQGRFARYHEALFAAQDSLETLTARQMATRVEMPDQVRFQECRASERSAERVELQATEVGALGLAGTPAFIVRGRLLVGPTPRQLVTELRALGQQ